jgi:hypothetical protein
MNAHLQRFRYRFKDGPVKDEAGSICSRVSGLRLFAYSRYDSPSRRYDTLD